MNHIACDEVTLHYLPVGHGACYRETHLCRWIHRLVSMEQSPIGPVPVTVVVGE